MNKESLKNYVINEWIDMGLTPKMVKESARKIAGVMDLFTSVGNAAQQGVQFITQTAPVLSFMIPASVAATAYYLTHQSIRNENIAKDRKKLFGSVRNALKLDELIEDEKQYESRVV